jgi:shikimate dehydrogenase
MPAGRGFGRLQVGVVTGTHADILEPMQLVGVLGRDQELLNTLASFRDPHGRFHLHPLHDGPVEGVLSSLVPLEFAGALLLGDEFEQAASGLLQRHSLAAQEVGAVDTVSVAGGSLIGEYNAGRAVGSLLAEADWDARGARVVLLGSGRPVSAIARELSSMGVAQLVILAENRPAAERTMPTLAASTEVVASALADPRSDGFLAEADLLIRSDPAADVPVEAMGPHLCLVDLRPERVSQLRQQALNVGALTFNLLDFQAHRLVLGLTHVLGAGVELEPFLALLHETPSA